MKESQCSEPARSARQSALGHEVTMGSRSPDNAAAVAWADHAGEGDAATGVIVDPARVPGDHDIELGEISTASGTEGHFLAELPYRPHSGL